jgi:hypothetical protein
MNDFSTIAQFAGVIGVILSMLTVAKQIHDNTQQSKLANWGVLSERYMSVYRETNNLELANLIAKGRQSYAGLTDGEKISFGHYLETLCIANEGALVFSKTFTRNEEEMIKLFNRHIQFHLSFNGSREWWTQFKIERGLPSDLTAAIERAIV